MVLRQEEALRYRIKKRCFPRVLSSLAIQALVILYGSLFIDVLIYKLFFDLSEPASFVGIEAGVGDVLIITFFCHIAFKLVRWPLLVFSLFLLKWRLKIWVCLAFLIEFLLPSIWQAFTLYWD